MMIAQVAGLKPGEFVHTLGDAHIYANHFEQARLQLSRTPKKLPTMWINPEVKDLLPSVSRISGSTDMRPIRRSKHRSLFEAHHV